MKNFQKITIAISDLGAQRAPIVGISDPQGFRAVVGQLKRGSMQKGANLDMSCFLNLANGASPRV